MARKCREEGDLPSSTFPLSLRDPFSSSKHFHCYLTGETFHFRMIYYFSKNHEIASLVVRKVKKS